MCQFNAVGRLVKNEKIDVPLCNGAIQLSLGAAPVQGTTFDAANNYGSTEDGTLFPYVCSSALWIRDDGLGSEVVYRYTPTTAGPFSVILRPSPYSTLFMWVTKNACGTNPSNCMAALQTSPGYTSALEIAGEANATYYFLVENEWIMSGEGPFTIQVAKSCNPLVGSSCGNGGACSWNGAGFYCGTAGIATVGHRCTTYHACGAGLSCIAGTCRANCDIASPQCGIGEYCESLDLVAGVCVP